MSNEAISCLTIVSKNYISCARVLCDSFLEHHPGARFFVLLVDKNDGYIDEGAENFTLLELGDLKLPHAKIFPYQYNILELNTAVKPYALKHLFDNYGCEKLTYIDPDIQIFSRLDKVWAGLEDSDVVLTPHMREPFDDGQHPAELSILQSGTYNLGFIGLRRGEEASKLLSWWQERLYLNCVVDIPRGLFTDQKWMDLVPAYFQKTLILHSPEYNIAYWNLHERVLTEDEGTFFVDGTPLAFFHFSGFDPRRPEVLSKHQNRHNVKDTAALEKIFQVYGQGLLDADLVASKDWPFAYKCLSNGVQLSDPIHYVIRECLRINLTFPCPEDAVNDFCEFLLTPNRNLFATDVAPLVGGILHCRPDVATAFPNARSSKTDAPFQAWLKSNGVVELGLDGLAPWFKNMTKGNSIDLLGRIYRDRPDVQKAHPAAFQSSNGRDDFLRWAVAHGAKEYAELSANDIEAFREASGGVKKMLHTYFGSAHLQCTFKNMGTEAGNKDLRTWALGSVQDLVNLSENEIEYFFLWAKHNPEVLTKANIAYNTWIREQLGTTPNVFSIDRLHDICGLADMSWDRDALKAWLLEEYSQSPVQHLVAHYLGSATLIRRFPQALDSSTNLLELFEQLLATSSIVQDVTPEWLALARADIAESDASRSCINIVGYFGAATGMGESAQSMQRILQAGGHKTNCYSLPSVFRSDNDIDLPRSGTIFGLSSALAKETIVVANADSVATVAKVYPLELVIGRKIAFWVWETESLPHQWRNEADQFDEIWTPSQYSADAIEQTIQRPVRAIPHCIDSKSLLAAKADRKGFGLPNKGFIFGYFFDQKSFLERKNPEAIIDAFERSFAGDDKTYLLMKVNTPKLGNFDYEALKARSSNPNIIWFEETLSRSRCNDLMASIDAYVSLHRSEGFGLTMAEAMTLGKPTIGSSYSGNLEFMTEDNSFLCATDIVAIRKKAGPYQIGSLWGNPRVEDAAELMKSVRTLKKPMLPSKGAYKDLFPSAVYDRYLGNDRIKTAEQQKDCVA